MPHPSKDINAYREEIIDWARTNVSHEEIVKRIQNQKGILINLRTIRRPTSAMGHPNTHYNKGYAFNTRTNCDPLSPELY
jgi:hypothetical protein